MPPLQVAALISARPNRSDLPDYVPPFEERAITSDTEDNVWVKTTQIVDHRPVYDVINRHGDVTDRVQLPPYRTIAGFGPGVIYMAVTDADKSVRLERARLK